MTPHEWYYDRIRDSKNPGAIRRAMVEFYLANDQNTSLTARVFRCSRPTVDKWVHRYKERGWKGLKELSRRPHHMPTKISPQEEELIEQLRTNRGKRPKTRIGQDKIQLLLEREGIKRSTSTINRVLHARNLIQPRKKKYQKKRQIAAYRQKLKALAHWQLDVKSLEDIPSIYPQVVRKLFPRYQYSVKDVVTTTTFIAYAYENSLLNATRFVALFLSHLISYRLDPSQITIQTDNGSEFIGSIFAKGDSLFTQVIEVTFRATHITIPPATPRFNGSVENFHGRIEDEFYDLEELPTLSTLLNKAYTYMLYFNLERVNLDLKRSPFEMVKEGDHIQDPNFMDFPPVVLDYLPLEAPELLSVNDVSDDLSFSCDGVTRRGISTTNESVLACAIYRPFSCSMYCFMTASGAPPTVATFRLLLYGTSVLMAVLYNRRPTNASYRYGYLDL